MTYRRENVLKSYFFVSVLLPVLPRPTNKGFIMMQPRVSLMVIVLSLLSNILVAGVKLPAIFGDNMVLQQKTNAPIWGCAEPGEKIHIQASWRQSGISTTANNEGKWQAKIKTPKAGGPFTISITGRNKIVLKDVLIGEVWVCSGQSNMALQVENVNDAKKEKASATYPNVRFFTVNKAITDKPQSDCAGSWSECTPDTVGDFSATAYFFGRQLHHELDVPIGLIHASVGGTPVEAWTRIESLQSEPDAAPILERYAKGVANFDQATKEHAQKLKEWEEDAKKAVAEHLPEPSKPYNLLMAQTGPGHFQSPGGLYNGMIAPLIPYRIRGVIWYQGEDNALRAWQYRKLFPVMINSWRNEWGQGEFPFYYVQIAPFDYSIFDKSLSEPICPELREAQMMAMIVPNTGMAVTMDVDDTNNIHPKNKQDVGKRLALWALAKTYGQKGIVYSGPLYKEMKMESSKIRISFDYVGSGLMSKGDRLTHFTIAGQDREFVEADAQIDGNTIVVSSEKVKNPVAVRFAWSNTAVPNLFNKEGLPASSFRTDNWPCVTANRR
jgi:sialate O-acetylesterase